MKSVKFLGRAFKAENDMETSDDVDVPSGLESIISAIPYNPLYFTMIYKDNKGISFNMLTKHSLKMFINFSILIFINFPN